VKLVSFTTQDGTAPHLGALKDGDSVVDLTTASQGKLPADMRAFLELGEAALKLARKLVDSASATLALEDVRLLPPVGNPSKVVAIGLNYMDHCREQGTKPPTTPVIFTKFSTAIVGPGDEIRWNPALTQQVDYEAELAVVIGKRARSVPAANAFD
jgi:2-keto-4-pentenoate hydratase/2-oxohepta-3-ene-1,7-dioic acid hydratase in catechol pathway